MRTLIQRLLLGTYKCVLSTGLLSTRAGRALYEWLYDRYKTFIEAGDIQLLAPLLAPQHTVLDIGANVGFFTKRFARWLGSGGRVIAIEPEATNFQSLQRMVNRSRLGETVELIQGVADERTGTVRLQLNPFHPADHRIAEAGIPVNAFALDDLLAERNWPRVSLIKIDVQGAEERVLRGGSETLRRFHPALFIEIDQEALAAMHSSAERVFRLLADYGYEPHQIEPGRLSPPLTQGEALGRAQAGHYTDFLFLAPGSVSPEPASSAAVIGVGRPAVVPA